MTTTDLTTLPVSSGPTARPRTAHRQEPPMPTTVTVTISLADLEALLLDLETAGLPSLTTADGTDRTIKALTNAWKEAVR